MRRFLKRNIKALRVAALERLYDLTARNWHMLETIPLHTIPAEAQGRNIIDFGTAQIHDPRGSARFWPSRPPALGPHLEPQVIPRPYLVELPGALVSHFTVVDLAQPDRVHMEIFPEPMRSREHIHFMDKTKNQRKALLRRHGARPADHPSGYLLGAIGWQNYYHTIIDHALRFAECDAAGQIPDDTVIVLPKEPNGFQSAILELVGITSERIVAADRDCLKLGRLLLPSVRRYGRAVSRVGLHAFRAAALSRVPPSDHSGRRLYLSRGEVDVRQVTNEPEVEAFLRTHGFETVQPGQMSLSDQIDLFSGAEIIAGPHGAALTNMIFAEAPHIIEFLPADLWDLGYFAGLATSHGGRYDGIVCGGTSANDDMRIDLDLLAQCLATGKNAA